MWFLRILFVLLFWICAYFYGDWKNWRNFQSTILFLIAGDLFVFILTVDYALWDVSTTRLNRTINDFLISLLVFPPLMFMYLRDFPKSKAKKFLRVLFWTFIFSSVEYVELLVGNIHYEHGWNFWWSVLVNLLLFSLAYLHQIRPISAYSAFGLLVVLMCLIFNVPLSKMK